MHDVGVHDHVAARPQVGLVGGGEQIGGREVGRRAVQRRRATAPRSAPSDRTPRRRTRTSGNRCGARTPAGRDTAVRRSAPTTRRASRRGCDRDSSRAGPGRTSWTDRNRPGSRNVTPTRARSCSSGGTTTVWAWISAAVVATARRGGDARPGRRPVGGRARPPATTRAPCRRRRSGGRARAGSCTRRCRWARGRCTARPATRAVGPTGRADVPSARPPVAGGRRNSTWSHATSWPAAAHGRRDARRVKRTDRCASASTGTSHGMATVAEPSGATSGISNGPDSDDVAVDEQLPRAASPSRPTNDWRFSTRSAAAPRLRRPRPGGRPTPPPASPGAARGRPTSTRRRRSCRRAARRRTARRRRSRAVPSASRCGGRGPSTPR